jgi:uncharacterized lipoprotein YmbA
MARLKQQNWVVITFPLVCLLLAGCGTTQPSRYYMLKSITDSTIEEPRHEQKAKVHIGVGPITVPKYLDRYPIVKRSAGSEVIIDDLYRWAEPLADNMTRVMASNLSHLLGVEDVSVYPWQNPDKIDYQVAVDVQRFDADMNNNVVLNAHWTINGKACKHALYEQQTSIREKADNGDYATLVSTESKAIEKLSQEIADELKKMIASVSNCDQKTGSE